jgi:H+/Cl- antiporter ClcA
MNENLGKWLLIAGIMLAMAGLVLIYFKNVFSWFGNLPGDIKIQKENSSFFFPLTSMLLISLVLNILIWLIRMLNNK